MKILVACEFSGIVRDAFIKKGHNAISCDFLDTERPGPHYKGDVLDILYSEHWDMLIGHPSCQYLSNVANKHYNIERFGQKAVERHKKRESAKDFFLTLYDAPIKKICIENPVGYINRFLKPSQVIHPYFFGEREMKKTCLFLKNLKPLIHIKHDDLFYKRTHTEVPEPDQIAPSGKRSYFVMRQGSKNKSHERSRTFQCIADAMAAQWG